MSERFVATIQRAYALDENHVLILDEGYRGDVEVGDRLGVETAEGAAAVEVVSIAWGSALRADSPPLTLIVKGLRDAPAAGAAVQSAADAR